MRQRKNNSPKGSIRIMLGLVMVLCTAGGIETSPYYVECFLISVMGLITMFYGIVAYNKQKLVKIEK